jgi:hypothetical protein
MSEKPAPAPFSEEKRPPIALTPVESSQVAAIGYDEATSTLAVKFKYGLAIYHYPGVNKETYDAFMAAESIGKFFGQYIKPLSFTKYQPDPEQPKAEEPKAEQGESHGI